MLAGDDRLACRLDGVRPLGREETEPLVGPRGRLLDQRQGADELGEMADRHARDRKILDGPHRVDAPERVSRDVGLAQEVVLAAGRRRIEVHGRRGGDRHGPRRVGRRGGTAWHAKLRHWRHRRRTIAACGATSSLNDPEPVGVLGPATSLGLILDIEAGHLAVPQVEQIHHADLDGLASRCYARHLAPVGAADRQPHRHLAVLGHHIL